MVIAIFEQLVEDLENELMKTGNSPEGVRLPENMDFSHRRYLQNKNVNIGGRVTKMFSFIGRYSHTLARGQRTTNIAWFYRLCSNRS